MIIGILQFELLIHESASLKDKRRVVQSVKDRLHREHQAAVAEVDRLESQSVAVLGLAVVGREGSRIGEVLDAITSKLRELRDAELGDISREILHGCAPAAPPPAVEADPWARPDPDLQSELLDYFDRGSSGRPDARPEDRA